LYEWYSKITPWYDLEPVSRSKYISSHAGKGERSIRGSEKSVTKTTRAKRTSAFTSPATNNLVCDERSGLGSGRHLRQDLVEVEGGP
jgi:hypothetical protein